MTPTRQLLTRQVRYALSRGIPPQDAEDLVFDAWEKASEQHDPARGPFEPFFSTIVRTSAAYWWRRHSVHRRAVGQLRLLREDGDDQAEQIAAWRQEELLDALSDEERQVFHTWALQKHLGRSVLPATRASEALSMTVPAYENAKRRLKARLLKLLGQLGWTVDDVLHGGNAHDA